MAVTAQELDERVVCEAQRVVHPESVATAPLCVVELDLLPDAVEQREETVGETVSHRGDLAVLGSMERVPGRRDALVTTMVFSDEALEGSPVESDDARLVPEELRDDQVIRPAPELGSGGFALADVP